MCIRDRFKVDFELPLTNGIYGNSLRFGAKYASKTKDRNTLCYDYADAYKYAFDKDYICLLYTSRCV